MDRTFWMGKECEDIVSHVNAYQKLTSAEQDFKNQVGKTADPVNTSQLLSLTIRHHPGAHE